MIKKSENSQFTQILEIGVVPCFAEKLPLKSREVSPLTDARKREVENLTEGGGTVSPKFGKLGKLGLEM